MYAACSGVVWDSLFKCDHSESSLSANDSVRYSCRDQALTNTRVKLDLCTTITNTTVSDITLTV